MSRYIVEDLLFTNIPVNRAVDIAIIGGLNASGENFCKLHVTKTLAVCVDNILFIATMFTFEYESSRNNEELIKGTNNGLF